MTHTYKVTGMTCGNCEASIKSSLLRLPQVTEVVVSRENESVTISMDKHIPLATLRNSLDKKFSISADAHNEVGEQAKSWFETYKPVLFIFFYITMATLLVEYVEGYFDWMRWMRHFMAGFFLTFSFFKLLHLRGFAETYSMYDIIAKRWKPWGFVYGFIELTLGLAYLVNFKPQLTNAVTLAVMSISIVGVLQTVLNKRKIKCACLGEVFNLPMSTITIIEDCLMILMSALMLTII